MAKKAKKPIRTGSSKLQRQLYLIEWRMQQNISKDTTHRRVTTLLAVSPYNTCLTSLSLVQASIKELKAKNCALSKENVKLRRENRDFARKASRRT